jgi:hypothetical protein
MELVIDYSEQFWKSVQQSMRTLKGEIMVGKSLANVVNSEASEITIRMAGQNKNFKFESLPPGLALAIVKEWFDKNPANKATLGCLLLCQQNRQYRRSTQVLGRSRQRRHRRQVHAQAPRQARDSRQVTPREGALPELTPIPAVLPV